MKLELIDHLRLEVETTPTGLPNLVKNPSGEKGAWFWITPIANTVMEVSNDANGTYLRFWNSAAQACNFTSDYMPVAATKYVSARFDIVSITSGYNVKVTYDYYNSSRTFLSSSVQSGALSTVGTNYVASVQAPANTAYVKARFNFYNGGSNPGSNTSVSLRNIMVTWANTGTSATSRTNLINNPSCEVSETTGWETDGIITRTTSQFYVGTASWSMGILNGSATIEKTTSANRINVTAGKAYTLQVRAKVSSTSNSPRVNLVIYWYNSSGQLINSKPKEVNATTSWALYSVTGTAPSSATKAGVVITIANNSGFVDAIMFEQASSAGTYFDGTTTDTATLDYAWTGTAHNSTSTETTIGTAFGYSDPIAWRDILGPTHQITIDRQALDVGTLQATVIDALLDPAVSSDLAPGKAIRVTTTSDGTNWENLYEGRIDNANVTYRRDESLAAGNQIRTTIELTAYDNINVLANQGESRGMATMNDLPYILEGKGVPWNINGSGDQVTSATTVSKNENASAVDQIAITRDSVSGCAWVDRWNVLNAWDSINLPVAQSPTVNGTFEIDVAGWSATNGTLTRDTSQFASGVASMKVTATAAGNVVVTTPIGTSGFRLGANQTLTFATKTKAGATPRSITRTIKYYNSAGGGEGFNLLSDTNATSWSSYTNIHTSPEKVAYVAIEYTITGAAAGEVHYFDDIFLTYTPEATFSDTTGISYADIDAGFNTGDVINEVIVTWLRYNSATDNTEEIIYGPYRDQTSIDTYGPYSKTFVVQGTTENATAIQDFAEAILAANKTPVRRASRITVPVEDAADIAEIIDVDLYNLVHVDFSTIIDADYRVTGISHNISADPTGMHWSIDYTFSVDGSVASPQFTPSPNGKGATGTTISGDVVITGDLSVSGDLTTANIPYSYRYRASDQAIADNSIEIVDFGTNDSTTDLTYSAGTFTVNTDGVYVINSIVGWDTNTTGRRGISVYKGSTQIAKQNRPSNNALDNASQVTFVHRFTAGQTFSIRVYQNSGASRNIIGGQEITFVNVARIGN